MAIRFGTSGADSVAGSDLSDFLFSLAGNDTVSTGDGADHVFAGLGDDLIVLGTGHKVVEGSVGNDSVEAAAGNWVITLASADNTTTVYNLDTGQILRLTDVESIKLGTATTALKAGTDAADTLAGTSSDDFIKGSDGNDSITGGEGDDWVSGGGGSDTVTTGSGSDIIDERLATRGSEHHQGAVADQIDAGAGDDIILLGLTSDPASSASYTIAGGEGSDVVALDGWSAGNLDSVSGDQIILKIGSDTVAFATLTDIEQVIDVANDIVWTKGAAGFTQTRPSLDAATAVLNGTVLSEDLNGNAEDNTLAGGGGMDRFTGGDGTDTVVLEGRPAFYAIADARTPILTKADFTGIKLVNDFDPHRPAVFIATDVEKIKFLNGAGVDDDVTYDLEFVTSPSLAGVGSAGNDFIIVDSPAAFAGGSSLNALAGNDVIYGVRHLDTVDGGEGNDRIQWRHARPDMLFRGGDGGDMIGVAGSAAASGSVTIDGGAGNDLLGFASESLDATILGGSGADAITTNLRGQVDAGAGNDRVFMRILDLGLDSNTAAGGDGTDALAVDGSSTDFLISKAANGDISIVSKADGAKLLAKTFELLQFDDTALETADIAATSAINGGTTADTLTGTQGLDIINGDGGNDTITAGAGDDIAAGDDGNDTIGGDAGNDVLDGSKGDDAISGGDGDDLVEGGEGDDNLSGGAGIDTFYFDRTDGASIGEDTVADFSAGSGLGDVLAFSKDDLAFNSFEELMAAAAQVGANTVFTLGSGNTITVIDVDKTDFVADDFLFL